MADQHSPESPDVTPAPAPSAEVDDLLQVIAGTSKQMENIWEDDARSDEYFNMLRASVDRAAKIASELVKQNANPAANVLLHPELATLIKAQDREETKAVPVNTPAVLIADDEPLTLELMRKVLELAGFAVTGAANGFEALDLLHRQRGRFQLVILDFTMPFLNGEETFDRISASHPDLPVVITTAFLEETRLKKMFARGLAGFFAKPMAPDELVRRVAGIIADNQEAPTQQSAVS